MAFLAHHGIDLSRTFDASGLKKSEYGSRMKVEGKLVAYGVTPCEREGHSLRSRRGNCIRCFPASIRFQERADEAGYVYIAQSPRTKLIKVGFSHDQVENRIDIANWEGFGGCHDWIVRQSQYSSRAGRVEIFVHQRLQPHFMPVQWVRNGRTIETREIFRCALDDAIEALNFGIALHE